MRTRLLSRLLLASVALCLGACGADTGVSAEIHDTKYVAISTSGEQLSSASAQAPCALDQFTGLMWEVKSADGGLHDLHHTYSWYNPDESNRPQGLDYRGVADGGVCAGSDCDTWAFVQAVNEAGHCGFHDWRVPLRDELASISDSRKTQSPPTTNTEFFPNAQPLDYWSSNDYHFQYDTAWVWDFKYGHDRVEWKKTPKPVRLVRGNALQLARVKD